MKRSGFQSFFSHGTAALLLFVGWLSPMPGEKSSDRAVADESPVTAELNQWIEQLTDSGFAVRMDAQKKLLAAGMSAEPILAGVAADSSNPARQQVSQLLLERIRDREFQRRLELFVRDPSPEQAASMPEGARYLELVGDSPEDILLFLDLIQADPQLYRARLFDQKQFESLLEQRSTELNALRATESTFPSRAYLNLLLLAGHPGTRLPRATSTNISDALRDRRLSQIVADGVRRAVFVDLLNVWIERPAINHEIPLAFATMHKLAAGRTVSEQVLRQKTRPGEMFYALQYLYQHGNAEDLPLIETLFTVETKIWPAGTSQTQRVLENGHVAPANYSVLLQDVAMAVALRLRGQALEKSGFEAVHATGPALPSLDTLGFSSPASRQQTQDRYQSLFLKPVNE
ncbi:MAG: hypothetical protein KDA85_08215 [Planctomycetaceae bacterium]|nr:hypothetical protein [Planctomycetaceae bacterium]